MKGILLIFSLAVFFLFFFLFVDKNYSYAACSDSNATCKGTGIPCPDGTKQKMGELCTVDETPYGKCCVPDSGGSGGGGTGGGGGGGVAPPNLTTTGCGTGAMEVWTLDCIFPLLQKLINWALTFAGVVALILIIYSGIRFVTSGGDQKSVEGAKKTLTYAIAGLVLILLSFFIINIIAYATRVSCISFMGFDACP